MDKINKITGACLLAACLGMGLAGCKHKPDDVAAPLVSFKADVQPILLGNCTQSGCHGQENPEKLTLLTYSDVKKEVRTDKPTKSVLYEVLVTSDPEKRMPRGAAPLSDKSIATILLWIQQGANDN